MSDTLESQESNDHEITVSLVIELIEEQFPHWAHLPVSKVKFGGLDNMTFHLGKEMSIRLPSAEAYAQQARKEHKWLPFLTTGLSFSIPERLAMGQPSKKYPCYWTVYRWIEGERADVLRRDAFAQFAVDLAQFLRDLHKIDSTGGPQAGAHNFYRGDSPSVYDSETRVAISQLQDFIDVSGTTNVWERAVSSSWDKTPVWVHGDFTVGNILVDGDRLIAVIDFGCMSIGDPACDLVIAWNFLTKESREIFKSHLELDSDTWARARGWALWKALITLASLEDRACTRALKLKKVIHDILNEHEVESNL